MCTWSIVNWLMLVIKGVNPGVNRRIDNMIAEEFELSLCSLSKAGLLGKLQQSRLPHFLRTVTNTLIHRSFNVVSECFQGHSLILLNFSYSYQAQINYSSLFSILVITVRVTTDYPKAFKHFSCSRKLLSCTYMCVSFLFCAEDSSQIRPRARWQVRRGCHPLRACCK